MLVFEICICECEFDSFAKWVIVTLTLSSSAHRAFLMQLERCYEGMDWLAFIKVVGQRLHETSLVLAYIFWVVSLAIG